VYQLLLCHTGIIAMSLKTINTKSEKNEKVFSGKLRVGFPRATGGSWNLRVAACVFFDSGSLQKPRSVAGSFVARKLSG